MGYCGQPRFSLPGAASSTPSSSEKEVKSVKKCARIFLLWGAVSAALAQTPDDLEMRVIAFCGVASLTSATQNAQICTGIAEICDLREVIDRIDNDLARSFAFVSRVSQIHLVNPGLYQGRRARVGGPDTLVFVTEPISALNGRGLVFVSTSAPARVAIFRLDPSLKGELIYDSIVKPKYLGGLKRVGSEPIEAIGQIRVGRKGSIILSEYSEGRVSSVARTFKLSYEGGQPALRLLK